MKKKQVFALGGLLLAVAVMLGVWFATREDPQEGVKHITVDVVHGNGTTNSFTYDTDEEYLGALLQDKGLIQGEESQYGLFVKTVDGETADYAVNQSWWQLSCNGESSQLGADQVVITDGSVYTWTYTIG